MKSPNEFWLQLHHLAEAYEEQGLNSDERAESIIAQFRGMPHIARRALLDEFRQLANSFPDLFALSVAAARGEQNRAERTPNEGVA